MVKYQNTREILLNAEASEKFLIRGKVIDIKSADIIKVAIINIGNSLVEVVLSNDEARKIKTGDYVALSTEEFHPNIKVINENIVSRR